MGVVDSKNKIGYFDEAAHEFVVIDPNQKRYQDNFLFNRNYFSYLTHTGIGYSSYTDEDDFNTRVINSFFVLKEYQHSRIIYIKNNENGEYWSVGWEPVCKQYEKYECRIGLNYNIITNVTDGIKCIWKVLVPEEAGPVELWDVSIETREDMDLSIYFYTHLSLESSYDTYGHIVYTNALFNNQLNSITANTKAQLLKDKLNSASCIVSLKPDSYTCSSSDFFGLYGSTANPVALSNKELPNTVASKELHCAAFQFHVKTEAEKCVKINNIIIGHNQSKDIEKLSEKYRNFTSVFEKTKQNLLNKYSTLKISTGNVSLDRITNIWNKHQILYGANHCRWGIKGYRDIAQHSMGALYFDTDLCKGNLIKLLKHQYSNGFAVRSFPLVYEDSKMHYSDSALWLVYTITEYLKETGDMDFLSEKIDFLDKGQSTVLERLDMIVQASFNDRGEHGLVKIHGGDWNDSLTHVGKEGKGESIWLTMFLAKAILLLEELKNFLKQPDTKYRSMYNSLKDALNEHAWDGEWYIRAFNDKDEKIGSNENKEGKIFLNPQAWSIISDVADERKIESIKKVVNKYLSTDIGHMLNYPTYMELDENIGRMTVMEPGTAENGSVYMHGNAFMIYALLSIGDIESAYEILKRIHPENPSLADKPICPYVYGNCYYGPSHRKEPGRMEISWITGSANWILQSVVEMMLGVRRTYGGLVIKPMLPSEMKKATIYREFRGCKYLIEIDNSSEKIEHLNSNGITLNLNMPLPLEKNGETVNVVKVY